MDAAVRQGISNPLMRIIAFAAGEATKASSALAAS
jgi:hypothetical protein